MNNSENFTQIVEKLKQSRIPCRVKLTDDEIVIECGFHYPNKLIDKIYTALDPLTFNDYIICAEQSGPKVINSVLIAGGPKRY